MPLNIDHYFYPWQPRRHPFTVFLPAINLFHLIPSPIHLPSLQLKTNLIFLFPTYDEGFQPETLTLFLFPQVLSELLGVSSISCFLSGFQHLYFLFFSVIFCFKISWQGWSQPGVSAHGHNYIPTPAQHKHLTCSTNFYCVQNGCRKCLAQK